MRQPRIKPPSFPRIARRVGAAPVVGVLVLSTWLAGACATAPAPSESTVATSANGQPAPVASTTPPESGPAPSLRFPEIARSTTAGGLEVNAVQLDQLPTIDLKLVVRSGSASDPKDMPGIAHLVAAMLKEGTTKHSSAEIAEQVDFLGARLWVDSDEENIYIQMRALSEHLQEAMDLMAELAMRPAFSTRELAKLKKREQDRLALSKKDPNFLASREFFKRLYGDHPYAHIDTTEKVVQQVRAGDLKRFHRAHFLPNNAFLVAAGAPAPAAIQAAAEDAFKGWRSGKVPELTYPDPPAREGREVVIVDRPESVQSVIYVGNLALPRKSPQYIPLLLANQVLGGSAASRLFMDLREKQSLTYGAYSHVFESVGVAPFRASAAVRNEVTGKAMAAFMKHLAAISAEAAPPAELAAAKRFLVDQLPLRIDTAVKVVGLVANLRIYGLPDDYWNGFRGEIENVSASQAQQAADDFIRADDALIVVVGQAAAVKDAVAEYGPVTVVDLSGTPITVADTANEQDGAPQATQAQQGAPRASAGTAAGHEAH